MNFISFLFFFTSTHQDAEPKHKIHISGINVMMVDNEMAGVKHCMMITFSAQQNETSRQRHIYVHADNSFVSFFFFTPMGGFFTPMGGRPF